MGLTFRDLSRALKGFGSVRVAVKTRVLQCRSLIKKPGAFIRVPYMNPTILGLKAQGFLIRFLQYPGVALRPKAASV